MNRAIPVLMLALGAIGLGVQPAEPPAPGVREAREPIPRLDERLGALDPARPEAYFELGEEVAALGDARLATQLHALALSISLETGDAALGAGACLALADLAGSERDRRWLVAVARGLDDRFAPPAWSRGVPRRVGEVSERAAEVFDLVRAGDGYAARTRLDEPAVGAAIERTVGAEWIDRLRAQADAWPCAECRNRRFVPSREASGGQERCPVCGGNPGAPLDRTELLAHLGAESALLGVETRSWAALLLTGGDEPMRDPDPGEVCERLGVDGAARHWRAGRWVRTPTPAP